MNKRELYDKLCHALTLIETGDEEKTQDAYELLVELQNAWEEVIGTTD